MNYNELVILFKTIAVSQPTVKSVYDGDVYDNWNSAEVQYGSINMGLETISYDSNMCTFTVLMYYADRLKQDKSNVNSIYTDGVNTIQSVLNSMNQEDGIDIITNVVYTPFQQTFMDNLAGVYTEVEITTESSLGLCTFADFDEGEDDDDDEPFNPHHPIIDIDKPIGGEGGIPINP